MKGFSNKQQDINFKLEKFDDLILLDSINKLVYGAKVEKYFKQGSKKHLRIFFLLDEDYRYLQWISPQKTYTKSRIYLNDIKDISREIHWKIKNKNDQQFLRIQTHNYELVLQFQNERERDFFQCGLQHFIIKAQHHQYLQYKLRLLTLKYASVTIVFITYTLFVYHYEREKKQDQVKHLANILFLSADKDGSKTLSFDEVKRLMMELHVSVNRKYLKQLFMTYDINKDNTIDQTEFINIIRDINKKEELQAVFKKYCSQYNQKQSQDHENMMTIQEYLRFMFEEQKQKISIQEAEDIFRNLNNISLMKGDSQKMQADLKISFYQFSNLIFSQENSISDPKKEEVYQVKTIISNYLHLILQTQIQSNTF